MTEVGIPEKPRRFPQLAFLAMAHHFLGDHDEARRLLGRFRNLRPNPKRDGVWHQRDGRLA